MSKAWLSNNAIALAGTAAVLCGLLFLTLTGAPPRLLLINLVALGAGIALLAIARLLPVPAARPVLLLSAAAALLATALFGTAAEGATRWVVIGGLSLQPSLILAARPAPRPRRRAPIGGAASPSPSPRWRSRSSQTARSPPLSRS